MKDLYAEMRKRWRKEYPALYESFRTIALAAGFDEKRRSQTDVEDLGRCVVMDREVIHSLNTLERLGRLKVDEAIAQKEEKHARDAALIAKTLQTWKPERLTALRMRVADRVVH